ncbi:MAG: LptA/OstA family protein, partial [Lentimonas sp.]
MNGSLSTVLLVTLLSMTASAEDNYDLQSTSVGALLDWQPIDVIPSTDRDLRCRQCQGAFVDPLAGSPKVDPLSANMEVSAEDSDVTEEELVFEGDVSVKQGSRYIRADKVRLDRA